MPQNPVVVEKKEEDCKVSLKEQYRREKMEKHKLELQEKIKDCTFEKCSLILLDKPQENPNATNNALNTLFVGNLNYATTESRIRDVFEKFGPIENLVLVKDLNGHSRGYAFVEYSYAPDMRSALDVVDFSQN